MLKSQELFSRGVPHGWAGMTDRQSAVLIRELADGGFRSGERLADLLGVSRAAVWKRIRTIGRETGLSIHAVRGKGYRLAEPLELVLERGRSLDVFLTDAQGRPVQAPFLMAAFGEGEGELLTLTYPKPLPMRLDRWLRRER